MTDTGGQQEYLDAGVEPNNDNRKRLVVLGGVVATAAVIGGAAWAATSFFATGAQPAEALPASGTIAYVSVDLDPSGSQKVEAIRTLRKFPGFKDEFDLDTDDDLREQIFLELTESGECEGLDYEADVAPWLGSRAAMAAVESGDEQVAPIGVIQVTDADKAEEGMTTFLKTCGGDDEAASAETGPWVVEGDWMLVGESREAVQEVVDATVDGPLAEDEDFTRWTDKAGDPGILSLYVAEEGSAYFDDLLGATGAGQFMGVPGFGGDPAESLAGAAESFKGMAMTVRFDDGALEIETATSANPEMQELLEGSVGADLVSSLPEDTVAAAGFALQDGWVDEAAQQLLPVFGGEGSVEELYEELSAETGLELPEDLETLFGEGVAVALGDDIDIDAAVNGGPLELPIGLKIKGDPDEIQRVLDVIEPQLGPTEQDLLATATSDDHVALSPDEEFRQELAEDGSLGDNKVFEDVVGDADDAQAAFFVNFNADDDWLVRFVEEVDPEVAENVAPLAAFGISGWFDDGVAHGQLRLTTD